MTQPQWGQHMRKRVAFVAAPFEQLQAQREAAERALKASHEKLLAAGFTVTSTGCYLAPKGVSPDELKGLLA